MKIFATCETSWALHLSYFTTKINDNKKEKHDTMFFSPFFKSHPTLMKIFLRRRVLKIFLNETLEKFVHLAYLLWLIAIFSCFHVFIFSSLPLVFFVCLLREEKTTLQLKWIAHVMTTSFLRRADWFWYSLLNTEDNCAVYKYFRMAERTKWISIWFCITLRNVELLSFVP